MAVVMCSAYSRILLAASMLALSVCCDGGGKADADSLKHMTATLERLGIKVNMSSHGLEDSGLGGRRIRQQHLDVEISKKSKCPRGCSKQGTCNEELGR